MPNTPRIKKGTTVRLGPDDTPAGMTLIGKVVRNQQHKPYPYMVEIDINASTITDDQTRQYYTDNYAGPFDKSSLIVI